MLAGQERRIGIIQSRFKHYLLKNFQILLKIYFFTFKMKNSAQIAQSKPQHHKKSVFINFLMQNVDQFIKLLLYLLFQQYLKMSVYKKISILVFLTCLSWQMTAPMSVSPNDRFICTGDVTIQTQNTFNNATAANWNPLTYTTTYPITFGQISNIIVTLSIKDLYADLSSNRISFYCDQEVTNTLLYLNLYSNLTSKIQTLSYRYLAIANTYSNINNIGGYSLFYNISANISSAFPLKMSIAISSPLNLTRGVDIFITFLGLDLKTKNSSNIIDLQISATFIASFYMEIYLKSQSSVPVFLYMICVNWLSYNKGYFNKTNFAYFTLQRTQGSSFTVTNSTYVYGASTMVGLQSIKINGDSFIEFKTQIDSPNSFSISTSNKNSTFAVSYLLLLTYYCSYKTPYYYSPSLICYDTCPQRYYPDLYQMACLSCSYDCYTCNSSICLTCNSTQDHRALNTSSYRCVPENGYYESNVTVCLKCPYDCYTCKSNASCLSCDNINQNRVMNSSNFRCIPMPGYYESNTAVAAKCRFDCFTCNSSDKCSSCDNSGQHRTLNMESGRCVPVAGYYESNVSVCAACTASCSICQSSQKCNSCLGGYFLNSQYFCESCAAGCTYCTSNQPCQNSGNNTIEIDDKKSNIGIYIGCSIGGLLIIVGVVKFIHYRYQNARQRVDRYVERSQIPGPQAPAPIMDGSRHQLHRQIDRPDQFVDLIREAVIPIGREVVQPAIPEVLQSMIAPGVGIWYNKVRQVSVQNTCSICLNEFTFLRLDCTHFFHIQCIINWSERRNTCPNCIRDPRGKEHRLFCRICRRRQKLISFDDLINCYRQNRYEREGICDQCRHIAF